MECSRNHMKLPMIKRLFHLAIFMIATLLTQIGGLAYLVAVFLFRQKPWWMKAVMFVLVYAALSLTVM